MICVRFASDLRQIQELPFIKQRDLSIRPANVKLYAQGVELKDEDSFTGCSGVKSDDQTTYDKEHGKPIVQYSSYNYNRICIKFENGILNAEGDIENEICNTIVEYKGPATEYEKEIVGVTAEGTPITAEKPTEPYQEADF